jgi:hypothetical protein
MCYAYVTDDADIHAVRNQIAQLPEIESADLPADCYMAGKDRAQASRKGRGEASFSNEIGS